MTLNLALEHMKPERDLDQIALIKRNTKFLHHQCTETR